MLRCKDMKKKDETRIAIDAPWRSSIGRCMKPRKQVSPPITADAAETTATHLKVCVEMKERPSRGGTRQRDGTSCDFYKVGYVRDEQPKLNQQGTVLFVQPAG